MRKFLTALTFLFLWLAFSLASASFLDPDFGWHFKIGEWMWQNRAIPQTDLFSYTMSDFPWINSEWLGSLIVYRSYFLAGAVWSSVFFGFVAAISFFLPLLKQPIGYTFIPLVLAALANTNYMGIRPRVLALLFFPLVVLSVRLSSKRTSWFWLLPPTFFLWTNLHGSFFIGFLVLGLAMLTHKKHRLTLLKFSLLSFLITLVNPYGLRVYREVFDTILSRNLHFSILEWLPYTTFRFSMVIYTGAMLAFLHLFGKKFSLFDKISTIILLLLGFSSNRLMVYFFLFTLPLFARSLEIFYRQAKSSPVFQPIRRFRYSLMVVFWGVSFFAVIDMLKDFRLLNDSYYPVQAVAYLKQNPFQGNYYAPYNWGGYLIWQYPEKKVFIDGRMAIWKQNGYSAFAQERDLYKDKISFNELSQQYSISTVLLPVAEEKLGMLQSLIAKLFKNESDKPALLERLKQSGWQEVYKDEKSVILTKE